MLLLVTTVVMLSGCVEHRYYVSPFNGHHSTYHPMPLQSDANKSGYYLNAAVATGYANDEGVDNVFLFQTSASGAHTLGNLQGFYGLSLSLGNYKVATTENIPDVHNTFFGGTGFEGGINAVVSTGFGEWRILGVETSIRSEFGRYLQFRKNLPYDATDLVIKNKRFGTLGGYSELVVLADPYSVGLRVGAGTVLGSQYHNRLFPDVYNTERLDYRYLYFTTSLTKGHYTGYLRLNAATKAGSAMLGLSYRL